MKGRSLVNPFGSEQSVKIFVVTYQTQETVFYQDTQTLRRELKIQCALEYFFQNSRCLDSQ